MELPLAVQGGQMVDVPTSATWALWVPGTTSGGKEKKTDLELLCFTCGSSRNRVSEKDCSTPSGFGNMEVIHCYHRINCMPRRTMHFIRHPLSSHGDKVNVVFIIYTDLYITYIPVPGPAMTNESFCRYSWVFLMVLSELVFF